MRQNQTHIDNVYDKLCEKLFVEIGANIEYKFVAGGKSKKKLKLSKPYWDEELTHMWKIMVKAEKSYVKGKSNNRSNNRELKSLYNIAQKKTIVRLKV